MGSPTAASFLSLTFLIFPLFTYEIKICAYILNSIKRYKIKIKNPFPHPLNPQLLLTFPLLTMASVSFQKKACKEFIIITVYVHVPVSAPPLQLDTLFSRYLLLEKKDLISSNLSLRQYSFRLLKSDIAFSGDH